MGKKIDVYGSWGPLNSVKILPQGQLTTCPPEGPIPGTFFFYHLILFVYCLFFLLF